MRCSPTVLLLLLVIYGFLSPPASRAQGPGEPVAAGGFRLEQNYPNPFSRETWIPFYLEESLFSDGEPDVVTIQIFNVLAQPVAVPKAVEHPRGKNVPVINLPYADPGRKVVYWDGKDNAGRRVPSGVYYCQLVVNGHPPQIKKILVVSERRRRNLIPWFGRKSSRPD